MNICSIFLFHTDFKDLKDFGFADYALILYGQI